MLLGLTPNYLLLRKLKILLLIDSLGSGGAQRQLVNLACGLKGRDHDVELFIYYPKLDFFRSELDSVSIPVHQVSIQGGFSFRIFLKLIHLYTSGRYDSIISFLDVPNIYAELAKLLSFRNINLVVSERSSFKREKNCLFNVFKRWFHLLANHVVANSHDHTNWLKKKYWLKNKTHTIYNGYSVSNNIDTNTCSSTSSDLDLLIVGRINPVKNGFRILQGLIRFYEKHGYSPKVSWVGRQEQDKESLLERKRIDELLSQFPNLTYSWKFLGERQDVPSLLQQTDALIHISLFEGLPNVVCEAFIAGRPVIASNVCDHPLLVEDKVRGILCDPLSVESICSAIQRFVNLTSEERHNMGNNARRYAEQHLSAERMVSEYEKLLN